VTEKKTGKSAKGKKPAARIDLQFPLALMLGAVAAGLFGYAAAEFGSAGFRPSVAEQARAILARSFIDNQSDSSYQPALAPVPGTAGRFLASHFAQSEGDWRTANTFLSQILDKDSSDQDLLKRSMVLAMGAGDLELAAQRGQEMLKFEPHNSLALLFLSIDALSKNDAKTADAYIDRMDEGDMTDFIKPLLKGWAQAGMGRLVPNPKTANSIYLYHDALIALYLGNRTKAADYAQQIVKLHGLGQLDAERAADVLALTGHADEAYAVYDALAKQGFEGNRIAEKLPLAREAAPDDLAKLQAMLPQANIKNPAQGAALVMFDMSYLLYMENNDTVSKLFSSMALALDPNLTDARLLLADTLSRNGRIDDAVAQLQAIPPDYPSYVDSQRHAAELLADSGRTDEALRILNKLFTEKNDVESLIRIGDIYREKENFPSALDAYNRAAKKVSGEGGAIPEQYWYLLYGRGMAYERDGKWPQAESDLKAALVYRPDHPYLLNYLGYGWADKGENPEESLALIKKAASLRPTDGYITDSLGWVEYRMGRYSEALPTLERAVELLPYDDTINDHLGDAYWKAGRKVEARFQWQRAINNSSDKAFQERVSAKLRDGLVDKTRHASSGGNSAEQ
jgi:tetratricopeptide (TPR) repeat protein